MYVNATVFKAIWCVASGIAPRRAIKAVTVAKTPLSRVNCIAAGIPSAINCLMRRRSMSTGVLSNSVRCLRSYQNKYAINTPAMYTRAIAVDQPEPTVPIAGAPHLP